MGCKQSKVVKPRRKYTYHIIAITTSKPVIRRKTKETQDQGKTTPRKSPSVVSGPNANSPSIIVDVTNESVGQDVDNEAAKMEKEQEVELPKVEVDIDIEDVEYKEENVATSKMEDYKFECDESEEDEDETPVIEDDIVLEDIEDEAYPELYIELYKGDQGVPLGRAFKSYFFASSI